jgi:hypothetical protein
MFKHSFILMALAASVGVPYLSHSSEDLVAKASNWWDSKDDLKSPHEAVHGDPHAAVPGEHGAHPALPQIHSPLQAKLPPLEGAPTQDLAEIFRFDVSSGWVMSRWPRVSAGLAEIDSQGYRVPLVTGTAQDDLAGSLTYYFDRRQQVEKIVFRGGTGDPRRLVQMLTAKQDFKPVLANDPTLQLYQVKWNGDVLSELHVRPSRIVRADSPYTRYEVALLMRRKD